jgi:hypothetical protein
MSAQEICDRTNLHALRNPQSIDSTPIARHCTAPAPLVSRSASISSMNVNIGKRIPGAKRCLCRPDGSFQNAAPGLKAMVVGLDRRVSGHRRQFDRKLQSRPRRPDACCLQTDSESAPIPMNSIRSRLELGSGLVRQARVPRGPRCANATAACFAEPKPILTSIPVRQPCKAGRFG